MKRIVIAVAFLLHVGAAEPIFSQWDQSEAIDAYVNEYLKDANVPGLALAVLRSSTLVKAKGYGFANLEHTVPVRPDTVFQSGSLGKQLAATAIMMLVEEERLRVEDPISQYFPEAPESWAPITVRHLLTHTSGIKNYTSDDFDYRRDYSEDDLVRLAASMPLDFEPGERYSYSNTGYVLLGALIRRVTGQFYGDFLRDRIFVPLGMDSARVISEEDIVPNRAAGYRLVDGKIKNQEWVSPSLNTTADGALYLSVLDWSKWDVALDTERLLRRSTFEKMWTRARLNDGSSIDYGFGWRLSEVRGHPIVEHGGAWQGFTAHISRYPDDRLSVIVLTNSADAEPEKVAHHVAGLIVSELEPEGSTTER